MKLRHKLTIACLSAMTALGGCAFAEEALWPSITNTRPVSQNQDEGAVVLGQATEASIRLPEADDASYRAPDLSEQDEDLPSGGDLELQLTQRLIGEQAALDARDGRLQALRATSRSALDSFQQRAQGINKRLLASTGPNDAALRAEWGRSRGDLDILEEVSGQYRTLSEENQAAVAALTGLLAEARSAADSASEGTRERFVVLSGDVEKTLAVVEAMTDALAQDRAALEARMTMASLTLNAMEAAIPDGAYVGEALARRAQGLAAAAPSTGGAELVGQAEPLAVISFADDDNAFQPALFSIVYAALGRRPNAGFDLVGVSPSRSEDSELEDSGPVYVERLDIGRANAQKVRRALLSMGLPAERMTLDIASSPTARSEEVHIYVR